MGDATADAPAELSGTVRRVVYQGEDGFAVVELATAGETVTVVGHLPVPRPGGRMAVEGRWSRHPRYGRQFRAERWRADAPSTAEDLARLLATGVVEGVGPALARRIVEVLGPEVLRIIERDPDRLLQVPGVGPQRRDRIAAALAERRELAHALEELQERGVPLDTAWRLYAMTGAGAVARFDRDPLGALLAVPGFPFRAADALALRAGADAGDARRFREGVRATLREATWEQGHVYLPLDALLRRLERLLFAGVAYAAEELDPATVARRQLQRMSEEGEVVRAGERVYLPALYEAEADCARHALRLLGGTDRGRLGAVAGAVEPRARPAGDVLEPAQRSAVLAALGRPLTILTGGPGTGKTHTIATLIATVLLHDPTARVLLAAPTGRAARRLSQLAGRPATTLHRLLEFVPSEASTAAPEAIEPLFRRDEDNPLEGDLLVVDEASMLDLPLAAALLRAVPDHMNLLLVGDVDQLPPVGPGNVLRDLIEAGVPCVRLQRLFRQQGRSSVVAAAHAVRAGRSPRPGDDGAFAWHVCGRPDRAARMVVERAESLLRDGVPLADLQVIAPVHRGPAGVEALNRRLQERLNPLAGHDLRHGGQRFQIGDKVMCVRNNYEKGTDGIFNGHTGLARRIEPGHRRLVVDFDGEEVEFRDEELSQLRLAYCVTVHKSQGSEFTAVILCLLDQHRRMLRRKLLYTAITRARRRLELVGSRAAVARAVADPGGEERYSLLSACVDNPRRVW